MDKISLSYEFKFYIDGGEIEDTEEAREAAADKAFEFVTKLEQMYPDMIVETDFTDTWED